MNNKLTILCTLAVLFACSPAFAGDSAAAGKESQPRLENKMAAAGKGNAEKPKIEKQKKNKAEKAVLRKVTAEEIGKEAFCPVTGEKLTVKADTVSASYKGKLYYFCCPGCDKSFLANPEKFVNKKAAAPAKVYACPMGDYQGDKPGKCPKCGMTLEEKK